MPEFTGERVVPGFVDTDLLNEHLARYEFAARLATGKSVLDAGCGSGYGAARLAATAARVLGMDASPEAIEFARQQYVAPFLTFETGDCGALPGGPFQLVVAFEVIEHLGEWKQFLGQVRGVLSRDGLFLVSTPNKRYYAESRGNAGGNPFHVHEFDYREFQNELAAVFPYVELFLQNHVEGVAITPPRETTPACESSTAPAAPDAAHFFLAVCSLSPLPEIPAFVWIPGTGNVLRERERHIQLLNGEVELKTAWLQRAKADSAELLGSVRELNQQLEERNRWALETRAESERRGVRIQELQNELAGEQANFSLVADGYQEKVAELEAVNRAKTAWALETESRLTREIGIVSGELAQCAALLDRAENTVIERTLWAQSLERDLLNLRNELAELRGAAWVKAGGRLKLIPEARR